MFWKVFIGVLIPFFGTAVGSLGVFTIKKEFNPVLERCLSALAAGIMLAASIWSLIIPSLESGGGTAVLNVLQTASGFIVGIVLMIWADRKIECLYSDYDKSTLLNSSINRKSLVQFIAITLHNIPEGMAVGMVYSALLNGNSLSSYSAALILSLGIAAQNIPEGAIISMPLHAQGMSKAKAFLLSLLSGIVEPLGALLAIIASQSITVLLSFFLSFAAGAMVFVVTEQLIPEMYRKSDKYNSYMTVLFSVGFLLMMSLDVIFG